VCIDDGWVVGMEAYDRWNTVSRQMLRVTSERRKMCFGKEGSEKTLTNHVSRVSPDGCLLFSQSY